MTIMHRIFSQSDATHTAAANAFAALDRRRAAANADNARAAATARAVATLTNTANAAAALSRADAIVADAERALETAYTETDWQNAQRDYAAALQLRRAAHFDYTTARDAENAAPHRRTVNFR